ncbi:DUF2771 domain-containing protein [Streptomyces sp. TRM 70351]|uniref:DUF2771 domain-containing protein n=1 Tax=Streptomyces sp. TRM 70351 TaxID=3116552 RepID=UPI002E7B0E18|nr:DUF2771 domain-containing protein [Streptomyces sp. TRM 70351]MEE1929620.1 DUF2771 domain-containing protein [Streptomyces sp. TRM 70351]
MTSMLPGARGRRVRTAAAAGAACFALVALSACEKPTPVSTITVGSDSVHTEAACYNEGKKLGQEELNKCLEEGDDVTTIDVPRGRDISFGVEPDIAERGWQVWLGGRPLTAYEETTFQSLPGDELLRYAQQTSQTGEVPETLDVAIVEATQGTADEQPGYYGVWRFELKTG